MNHFALVELVNCVDLVVDSLSFLVSSAILGYVIRSKIKQ